MAELWELLMQAQKARGRIIEKDRSFSNQDIIRLYENYLERPEQLLVLNYFTESLQIDEQIAVSNAKIKELKESNKRFFLDAQRLYKENEKLSIKGKELREISGNLVKENEKLIEIADFATETEEKVDKMLDCYIILHNKVLDTVLSLASAGTITNAVTIAKIIRDVGPCLRVFVTFWGREEELDELE